LQILWAVKYVRPIGYYPCSGGTCSLLLHIWAWSRTRYIAAFASEKPVCVSCQRQYWVANAVVQFESNGAHLAIMLDLRVLLQLVLRYVAD
jgi:hypothetical protein